MPVYDEQTGAPVFIGSQEEQQLLLQVVRETARNLLGADAVGDTGESTPPVEGRFGGAFVTFWRGKMLRGCVGTFASTSDIVATLREVTRSSLNDSRFRANPITAEELPRLSIEVSILTDPCPTDDPASLIPGRHGIIIRLGDLSGCFLPKVAVDRAWSAEEFLSQCCVMKAALPADAWRDPETEVCLFEAQAFREPLPS